MVNKTDQEFVKNGYNNTRSTLLMFEVLHAVCTQPLCSCRMIFLGFNVAIKILPNSTSRHNTGYCIDIDSFPLQFLITR